jgi:aromatic-amino-acid transaminase
MYQHLPVYAGDPILSLHEAFMADPRPNKVSLSIGLYFDEQGRLPVLDSVRQADKKLREQERPSGYLPIEGAPDYRAAVQKLVFGTDSVAVAEGRIATIQGVGGSGAIRIGADFIKSFMPGSDVWVSDPTWDNHESLMQGAGLKVARYPYYDADSNGLRYEEMLAFFAKLPAGSVVLMQPCCHNPTGIDLSKAQWSGVIQVMKDGGLIPFLDMAYQGFGDGLEEDAWAVRAMVEAGLCPLVTNSFSKNFSLYGERCGGLSVVCPTAEEADRVLGQLKAGIRRVYSSPPLHGERLVAAVLDTPALHQQWVGEVKDMRERIKRMRVLLAERLTAGLPGMSVDFLTAQHGMFSYTGLTSDEVDTLREKHGIYLVRSGRMCVAGLNEGNVQAVADALIVVLRART